MWSLLFCLGQKSCWVSRGVGCCGAARRAMHTVATLTSGYALAPTCPLCAENNTSKARRLLENERTNCWGWKHSASLKPLGSRSSRECHGANWSKAARALLCLRLNLRLLFHHTMQLWCSRVSIPPHQAALLRLGWSNEYQECQFHSTSDHRQARLFNLLICFFFFFLRNQNNKKTT